MRILWIGFTKFTKSDGPLGVTSDVASARYRILAPIAELNKKGHQVDITSVTEEGVPSNLAENLGQDVVVFSKSFFPVNEQILDAAQQMGAKVVFDICDNHFENAKIGKHYKNMAKKADLVTCNTIGMADVVRRHAKTPVRVVDDPYDGIRKEAKFSPGETLKLVWFGHPANLDSLTKAVSSLEKTARKYPFSLTVVSKSQAHIDGEQYCKEMAEKAGNVFSTRFVPWSVQAQQQAVEECDLVIIPSLSNDVKNVKSPNRMVEPLLAGRMVVANPIRSYEQFKDWAWLGEDLAEGIDWVMQHRSEIPGRIAAAQDYIEKQFSHAVIGAKWEEALKSALAAKAA